MQPPVLPETFIPGSHYQDRHFDLITIHVFDVSLFVGHPLLAESGHPAHTGENVCA